jgi:hypothetical protein
MVQKPSVQIQCTEHHSDPHEHIKESTPATQGHTMVEGVEAVAAAVHDEMVPPRVQNGRDESDQRITARVGLQQRMVATGGSLTAPAKSAIDRPCRTASAQEPVHTQLSDPHRRGRQ